ncbi:MAG: hypothetical protein ACD_69C00123G0002 [uncultured bacterium]|nr:MAG: hypothetical protein ACD_69C00123G0002 [uncultured bacterium]OGT47604.1 MAG: hypothetical protein A3E83_06900 [Gammaproteobacteria bacterium RIFCSPHIGHO2_12_FULL_41_20]HLB43511.1 hypothetical protein [Gammaproteobacteria bacterium]
MTEIMHKKYSIFKEHTIIFLTTLLAFFFIPLYMIRLSPSDYAFSDNFSFFNVGIIYAICYLILSISIYWMLYVMKAKKIAHYLVFFLFFWVLFAGYLFPVVNKSGMLDPIMIPTNKWNVLLVLFFSILLAKLINTRFSIHIVILTSVFLILAIVPEFYNGYQVLGNKNKNNLERFLSFSNQNNIIVLSFDGLSSNIVSHILSTDKKLKETFKDFIFFQNAIASSPATMASIMGELFGNLDFKTLSKTQKGLNDVLDKDKLFINQADFETYTYGTYSDFNLFPEKKINTGELSKTVFLFYYMNYSVDFYKYVAVRIGTKHLLKFFNFSNKKFFDSVNTIIKLFPKSYVAMRVFRIGSLNSLNVLDYADRMLFSGTNATTMLFPKILEKNKLIARLHNHKGPIWAKTNIVTILDFDNMMQSISVGDAGKRARFMHFTFTHTPFDFDEYCNYRSDDQVWFDSNQNENGLINETKCALNKLATFLVKLKKLGIYDRSLVILKSDHGQPAKYYSTAPENYKINNHELWGYDRYRPLLLIKNYHQRHDKLIIKKEFVLLDDLATTIAHSSGLYKNGNIPPGINLLDNHLITNRRFHIYVAENQNSSFIFDSHKEVTLKTDKNLVKMMRNAGINLN